MADPKKISQLPAAGPLTGVELVPIVQNSGTLQTTVSAIGIFATSALSNDVAGVSLRLDSVAADVSVNAVQIAVVSALTSVNAAAITSINAVVSTKAFRDGDYLTNVQYIDFNTTTSFAVAPGRLTWDIESGTLDLGLTGTVNLLIGQRTVAQVYNNSGVTLPKGKAVRVTGAQGQRLTGALAQADSDADSLTIFGIMLETVSVNRSGYVATDGLVKNVNTIGYTDGQIVYLSPVSAGELTPIKPVAPQHLVQMGYIVNGGSGGAGEIYVKVQNGYEIGELHDVKTSASTSLADGEVLAYNVSAKVWTNSTIVLDAQASISVLNVQMQAVQASISAINSALATIDASALAALEPRVSALEIRVANVSASVSALQVQLNGVSAAVSANAAAITSVNAVVSALDVRVSDVSAAVVSVGSALTSTNNVVSALEIRVSAASATGATNAAAITSINNVVSALEIRVSAVSAAAVANAAAITSVSDVVSTLEIRVSAASAVGTANSAAITSINDVVSALEIRVSNASAAIVSANAVIANVSAAVSVLDVRVAAVSASVSVLNVQMLAVQASISAINSVLATIDASVLATLEPRVSLLEIRVAGVSASVSALQVQLDSVSAALTSTNNVVSALEIRVSAASATGVTNSAAVTSINNVVSALEIRVSAASATGTTNAAAITSINNVVSALEVRVSAVSAAVSVNTVAINAVSAAVSLRVLRSGDTMTGALTITTSADQQGLTVAGRATFDSLVSISAGTYTGLQNYQDNTLQRATFRDYALVLVARGSVSATATLDLTDGNFFQARAAGSTTFVFANPPVSAIGTGAAAGGFILELQNGGAATVTWPSTVRWPGGTAPSLTSSGFDVLTFVTDDGGTNWRGVMSMKDSK